MGAGGLRHLCHTSDNYLFTEYPMNGNHNGDRDGEKETALGLSGGDPNFKASIPSSKEGKARSLDPDDSKTTENPLEITTKTSQTTTKSSSTDNEQSTTDKPSKSKSFYV